MMLEDLSSLLDKFGSFLMSVLPLSPFQGFIQNFSMPLGLRWLNWFFPVHECLTVLSAWLVAYGVYLIYSIIMRWVKVIE